MENEIFFKVKDEGKDKDQEITLKFMGFVKIKEENPRAFKFLFQKADGSFTMLGFNEIQRSDKTIKPKELKPGCIVECIQQESELYGERLVVEAVEGLTIIVKTEGGEIMKMDIFSIKVV